MSLLDTFSYDNLISGCAEEYVTGNLTLLLGQGPLARGTVLGKVTVGGITETHAGNTGNGVMGAMTAGTKTKPGVYTLRVTKAATNAGDFEVIDPNGAVIGVGTVAVAFVSKHLNFTLADGSADFIVGDVFLITVAAGTGKAKIVDSSAVDGSGVPYAVMLDATPANAGADTLGIPVALSGEFNEDALVFGGTDTKETHRDYLRSIEIYLKKNVNTSGQ